MQTLEIRRFTSKGFLKIARVVDYKLWCDGFMAKGGEFTHFYKSMYDDAFDSLTVGQIYLKVFYVAPENFRLKVIRDYEICIIVPEGIDFEWELEENQKANLFLIKDFVHYGKWIPGFRNFREPTNEEMKERIKRETYEEEKSKWEARRQHNFDEQMF